MSDWPRFRSHKIIQAAKIVGRGEDAQHKPTFLVVRPEGGSDEQFVPTEAGMMNRVSVGDYALIYPDGFRSVSPAEAFEGGYTKVED